MPENVNPNNLRTYEYMKLDAEMRKARVEGSPEFQRKLNQNLEDSKIKERMNTMKYKEGSKSSQEMTTEGLIKIMLTECKFMGLDQENKSNSTDTITSITNLESSNNMKNSIKELVESNQLLTAKRSEGEEIEAYQEGSGKLREYYKAYPEERPTITGKVIGSSKENNNVYLKINTTPDAPKGSEKIIKVKIKDVKDYLPDRNIQIKKFIENRVQIGQFNDALKGTTVEAFAPLDEEMLKLKEYIDPEYRPTIQGEVIDVVKGITGYYVNIKHGEEIVRVDFNDLINP